MSELTDINRKLDKLLLLISGPDDHPERGLCWRVTVLERVRASGKTWKIWVAGIMGSVISACVTAVAVATILKRIIEGG